MCKKTSLQYELLRKITNYRQPFYENFRALAGRIRPSLYVFASGKMRKQMLQRIR
jgi:hypothetical protein